MTEKENGTEMIIYNEVQNCTYENYQNNQPVLIAPQGYVPLFLTQNGFVALPDGRWAHFLTEQEYQYMCSVPQGQEIRFNTGVSGSAAPNGMGAPVPDMRTPEQQQQDKKNANILAGISAVCLALSLLLGGVNGKDLSGLIAILFQAGLVLMIICRVKYKDSVFGKVMMWIYIILFALAIIGVLLFIAACGAILKDCNID